MPDLIRHTLEGSPTSGLADLLRGYRVPIGHYDELLERDSQPRAHWSAFGGHAGPLDSRELSRAEKRIARQLHENGVTYNIHSTAGAPRPWALDVLPQIVTAGEWATLTAGLCQRARLLEAAAADIYGEQRLVSEGQVPV